MEHCDHCGKLIQAGEIRCRACRVELPLDPEDGALPPDAAVPDVRNVVAGDRGTEDPYRDEPCVRCRKHPAIRESEFCLACQLEMLSLLGEAAHDVFQVAPAPPKPPIASPASLLSDLEEKRDRTATSRIRVVGASKIK
jgi:hypothetical protein